MRKLLYFYDRRNTYSNSGEYWEKQNKGRNSLNYASSHDNTPIIVSGGTGLGSLLDPKYSCEAEIVRERLLQLGMPDSLIVMERRATNNVENILFSLEMFRGTYLAICSYPSHIRRFKHIIDVGKEFGEVRVDIEVESVETNERLSEKLYEIFATKITNDAIKNGLRNARFPQTFTKQAANYFMQRCPF